MNKIYNLKDLVLKHYGFTVLLILILAFVVRISLLLLLEDCFFPDSKDYYNAAINIVNGNGYSCSLEPPYYPFYYREPLPSYIMAFIIWFVNLFCRIDFIEYPDTLKVPDMQQYHQIFIYSIRVFSVFLQFLSIILYFKAIKSVGGKIFAIIFLLISAIYMPMIINQSYVLREPYVFFLLSLIFYFWCKFLENRKIIHLVFIAVTNGVLCLCLQIYWLLSLFVFASLFFFLRKEIKLFAKLATVYIVFLLITILPNIIQVYHYYPDMRIVKTLGTALTYECALGFDAYRAYGASPWSAKDSDLPNGLKPHPEYFEYDNPAKLFERSFDGTFEMEAKRLNSANSKKRIFTYYLDKLLLSFKNSIFILGINYDFGVFKGVFTLKDVAKFLVVFPFMIMGILGIIGVLPFLKKYGTYIPVFFFHTMLFFIFGDEERRQVMLVPYLICIVMYLFYRKLFSAKKGING